MTQLACDFQLSRCPEAAPVLFVKPRTRFRLFYKRLRGGGVEEQILALSLPNK